jgi:hypothetical protein
VAVVISATEAVRVQRLRYLTLNGMVRGAVGRRPPKDFDCAREVAQTFLAGAPAPQKGRSALRGYGGH